MEKILFMILCSAVLLMAPVAGRRGGRGGLARQNDDQALFGCCFVDMFCYSACISSGFNVHALVEMASPSGLHTSDSRRHRHRHQHRHRHGHSNFRVRRQTADNVLWQKLRKGFQMKAPEELRNKNFPET